MADFGSPGEPRPSSSESIWSSDDVPFREQPQDVVWARKNSKPDEEISFSPVVSWTRDAGPANPDGGGRSLGSKLLIGAAVLAAVGLVVGIIVQSARDDGAAVPQTTAATEPSSPPITLDVVPPPESGDTVGDPLASITPVDVELPASVAAISAPTEVIALNSEGVVHTLSLPSGRVRSVVVGQSAGVQGFDYRGGGIGVSPTAAAIGVVDSTYVMVPRTGLPIGVDVDAPGNNPYGGVELVGWQLAEDGSTQFTLKIYDADFTGGQLVTVDESGGISSLDPPDAIIDGLGFEFTTPEGSRIVNDAGGAYEIGADGMSHRIDDGTVYAATGDHRVVRQCDGNHRCEMTLVTASTGDRRVLDPEVLPEDFESLAYTMTLSPDGTAVSALRGGGGPSDQETVIVDLTDGEVANAPMMFPRYPEVYGTWAADSSGVFGVPSEGVGLQFIARSGETVNFGENLGEIVAIGVRHPDDELGPAGDIASTALTTTRPLDPTGIAFVGAGRAGGLSYVDVDSGVIESWATSADLGAGRGILLVTSNDAVLGLPYYDTPFVTRLGDEVSLVPELGVNGSKFAGPDEGTIWVVDERPHDIDGVAYRLARLDGQTVAEDSSSTIWIPGATMIGGDGSGNLVVERSGDVFVVGDHGAERLTSGELIAIGTDTAYARECDETLTCSLIRIDRQSGERRAVDAGFDAATIVGGATIERGPAPGTSVSPGGDVLLVELSVGDDSANPESNHDSWFFADTTTGRLTQLDDPDPNQPVIWSIDGTFGVVLTGPTVQIFDRAAAEMAQLNTAPMRSIGPAPAPAEWNLEGS